MLPFYHLRLPFSYTLLEAATLERVRNSSLVERRPTEARTALSTCTRVPDVPVLKVSEVLV